MLYWAEGEQEIETKLRFTNSDPEIFGSSSVFFGAISSVSDEKIRVTCHLFADHVERQHEIERFWLETLALPERRSASRS